MTGAPDDTKVIKMKPKKSAPKGGWQDRLTLSDKGTPKGCLANAIAALRWAPEWDGVLWYDEFAARTVARRPPPWTPLSIEFDEAVWTDCDDIRLAEWLQNQGIYVSPVTAGQAVEVAARNLTCHPVREYLDSLKWDGVVRLPFWLRDRLGVADTPYSRAVGCRWMISAVARVYQPGCKADCALILEGPQGLKKSTALAVLGGPWFTDQIADLGNKDSCVDVQGAWIIELAELDSMSRGEVGRIKAFMSRATDRFRMPFGKRTTSFARQCIFAGTVNPEGTGYLKDVTGGRRFWPVECTKIDIDGLEQDVDQLWAEAVAMLSLGHPWWLDTPELDQAAERQQRARYIGDAWEEPIAEFLSDKNSVSVSQILEYGLVLEKARWDQASQNRVARVLTGMKWKQRRTRENGTVVRRYFKPEPTDRSQQEPQNSAAFGDEGVNSRADRTQECSHENPSIYAAVNSVNSVNSKSITLGEKTEHTEEGGEVVFYNGTEKTVHTVHTVHKSDNHLIGKDISCVRYGVNGAADRTQDRSHDADCSHLILADDWALE